jgi:ribosome modulation factor
MTTETATPPFELSRAYANGWIAGKAHPIEDDEAAAAAIGAASSPLNPFAASDARARWADGFKAAIQRRSESAGRKGARRKTGTPGK